MNKSKLISLLKTFSKDEYKEFGQLIGSPLFNRETVQIKFYSVLRTYFPEFDFVNTNKQDIFSKLYPGKSFNDVLMRNTISDMLNLAKEYLKFIHLRSECFQNQFLLLKELTNRRQQELFTISFKSAEKALESSEVRDEIYFQNRFLLEDERRRNIVVNSSRVLYKDDNLNLQADNIRTQHLIENIKLYAIMLNQSKFIFDHNFDFTFFETIRTYIEQNPERCMDVPYISIFYNCVMLFKTGEKKFFDKLKNEMKKHYNKLSVTDRKNMYIVLTNHSKNRIIQGEFEFFRENFEIYKDFIKSKACYEGNNFMAHYIYTSIALNALSVGEFEWAEKFVNKYRPDIHIDYRDSVFNYCYSHYYIHKEDYEKALEALSEVKPFDMQYKLNINHTLLMIYFCKKETESFISLVDSFRHFLKRNKEVRKEDFVLHNNFIKYLCRLNNIKLKNQNKSNPDIIILKRELEKNNNVAGRKWLLEIVEGLCDD